MITVDEMQVSVAPGYNVTAEVPNRSGKVYQTDMPSKFGFMTNDDRRKNAEAARVNTERLALAQNAKFLAVQGRFRAVILDVLRDFWRANDWGELLLAETDGGGLTIQTANGGHDVGDLRPTTVRSGEIGIRVVATISQHQWAHVANSEWVHLREMLERATGGLVETAIGYRDESPIGPGIVP